MLDADGHDRAAAAYSSSEGLRRTPRDFYPRVMVSHFPSQASDADIMKLFQNFFPIRCVRLRDRSTGRMRNAALVFFWSEADASAALRLDRTMFRGTVMRVSPGNPAGKDRCCSSSHEWPESSLSAAVGMPTAAGPGGQDFPPARTGSDPFERSQWGPQAARVPEIDSVPCVLKPIPLDAFVDEGLAEDWIRFCRHQAAVAEQLADSN